MRIFNTVFLSLFINFTMFGIGVMSTARAVTCPAATGAQFCNLQVLNNLVANQFCASGDLQIAGNLNVGGSALVDGPLIINGLINGITVLAKNGNVFFGNTCRVDQVNGDDALGNRNGAPFKTISAALAQAQPGDNVWIFPGVYNEAIAIPSEVAVSGVERNTVIIQQLNVTQATEVVEMEEGSRLSNVTIILTSSLHVTLHGIHHHLDVGSPLPTIITDVGIVINNANAGPGNSHVAGIHFAGVGDPSVVDSFNHIEIYIETTGAGLKRGIITQSANTLTLSDSFIHVNGGTDSIGIEVDHPQAFVTVIGGAVEGSTSDISQTQGTLGMASTYLVNSTANGLGFHALIFPASFIWGDIDTPIGGGQTLYMRPGSSQPSATPIHLRAFTKFVAKEISVRVIVPPGPGESTTWTLQRNGVDTILSITLSGNTISADRTDVSVHFDQGDNISMKMVTSAGATTGDALVQVAVY